MPKTPPYPKLDKIKYHGAELTKVWKNYDEAHAAAKETRKKDKLKFIHTRSDIQTISGQGSIALKILEANPDIDAIIAPIGRRPYNSLF